MMESFPKPDNSFKVVAKKDSIPIESLNKSSIKGRTSEFYDLPEREDVVVRVSYVRPPLEYIKYGSEPDIEGLAKYWEAQAKRLIEIGEKYNIRVAKTSYILEHDNDNKMKHFSDDGLLLKMITERISGTSIDQLVSLDNEAHERMDSLYSSVLSHVCDSYLGEKDYWADFKNSQIVYGTAPNENKKDVYVVDTDPEIKPWINEFLEKDVAESKKVARFWWYMHYIVLEIQKVENNTNCTFQKTRNVLREIIAKVPQSSDAKVIGKRDKILSFLE